MYTLWRILYSIDPDNGGNMLFHFRDLNNFRGAKRAEYTPSLRPLCRMRHPILYRIINHLASAYYKALGQWSEHYRLEQVDAAHLAVSLTHAF